MTVPAIAPELTGTLAQGLAERVAARTAQGTRFAGLFAGYQGEAVRLMAVLSDHGALVTEVEILAPGTREYPSLTARVPAASWYEREVSDLFGLVPIGHPRPGPLVLPRGPGSAVPLAASSAADVTIAPTPIPAQATGEGIFTFPYGPVRSGVFEAVGYMVDTPGEDIPYLRPVVWYKHRGLEKRFEQLPVRDGVFLAERYEGVASVAHALAFCQAIEALADVQVPQDAGWVRILHAELERVVNHIDSVLRHTEAAGQAVAHARFAVHKERLQRLRGQLCGSRFGRGVVVPGGISAFPSLGPTETLSALGGLQKNVLDDLALLMATPSFIDRLRGTGTVTQDLARERWALGPVGRASGQVEDVRLSRPYGNYDRVGHLPVPARTDGDALARQRVRADEIADAFHLVRQALDQLKGDAPLRAESWSDALMDELAGEAFGWAEAPQGELLYLVQTKGGRLPRVKVRSASFHNLAFFHLAFPKDILTDFAFIEASFGLSIAGVAG